MMKIAAVPSTIARFVCNGVGKRLIHEITIIPAPAPIAACTFVALFDMYPNKNNPSIPPLKMEDNAHHASNALFTLVIARPTAIPIMAMIADEV